MNDGGGVVPGVLPRERMARTFSKVRFFIALSHTFVDSFVKVTAGDMNILSQLHEHHGKAGVLAHGKVTLVSDPGIFQELVENILPGG